MWQKVRERDPHMPRNRIFNKIDEEKAFEIWRQKYVTERLHSARTRRKQRLCPYTATVH
jgi:hypothetical protein